MFAGKGIVLGTVLLWAFAAQAQDETALRDAERLGAELFELDRAVRAAQAAGQEWRAFRRESDILGWVADRQGDGSHTITFVGTNRAGEPVGFFQASVTRAGEMRGEMERLDRSALGSRQAAQFRARQRTANVEYSACSETYETVLLADSIQGAPGWRAYLLPRAAFPDVYLLGGSYRADVSEQGDAVRFFQPLASGCTVLQNVADAQALQFSDDQASAPNELHVYISRLAGKPLYVRAGGNGTTWLIQDGRIRAVENIPPAG